MARLTGTPIIVSNPRNVKTIGLIQWQLTGEPLRMTDCHIRILDGEKSSAGIAYISGAFSDQRLNQNTACLLRFGLSYSPHFQIPPQVLDDYCLS